MRLIQKRGPKKQPLEAGNRGCQVVDFGAADGRVQDRHLVISMATANAPKDQRWNRVNKQKSSVASVKEKLGKITRRACDVDASKRAEVNPVTWTAGVSRGAPFLGRDLDRCG